MSSLHKKKHRNYFSSCQFNYPKPNTRYYSSFPKIKKIWLVKKCYWLTNKYWEFSLSLSLGNAWERELRSYCKVLLWIVSWWLCILLAWFFWCRCGILLWAVCQFYKAWTYHYKGKNKKGFNGISTDIGTVQIRNCSTGSFNNFLRDLEFIDVYMPVY